MGETIGTITNKITRRYIIGLHTNRNFSLTRKNINALVLKFMLVILCRFAIGRHFNNMKPETSNT